MSPANLEGGGNVSPPQRFKGTRAAGCRPDAVLTVGGVEVPYVNEGIEVTERAGEGSADITRMVSATVPVAWGASDDSEEFNVAEAINGLSGGTPQRQKAVVELIDPFETTDEEAVWSPVMKGYVAAAGGHPNRGAARIRIADYAQLLGQIPASQTFEPTVTVGVVLKYVKEQFLSEQSVLDNLRIVVAPDEDQVVETPEILESKVGDELDIIEPDEGFFEVLGGTLAEEISSTFSFSTGSTHTFSADRDTLGDVMDWVTSRTGTRWYFQPRPPGATPTIVLERNPPSLTLHDVDHVDPPTEESRPAKVLRNEALRQMNPMHRLKARGKAPSSLERGVPFIGKDYEFPIVEVEYRPLVERAQFKTTPKEIEVDESTMKGLEYIAKQELADRLMSAAGGEIVTAPAPHARPFARFSGVPVCGSVALTELPTVDYSVTEVIHHIPTAGTDSEPRSPRTVLRVGLHVDEREIDVVSKEMVDA